MGKQIRDTMCSLKNLIEDIKCIVGMSFDKKKAEEKVEGLGGPVRKHFLKLLFFGDIESKWKDAIKNPPKHCEIEYLCYCDVGCFWVCQYTVNKEWVNMTATAQPRKVLKYKKLKRP